MSEAQMWTWLRSHLRDRRNEHWERMENRAGVGTPDLHYCLSGHAGWIELKEIGGWPRSLAYRINVQGFTLQQRFWHEKYAACGGTSWLLMRVVRERRYFLFNGVWAANNLNYVSRREWESHAYLQHSVGIDNPQDFVKFLRLCLIRKRHTGISS